MPRASAVVCHGGHGTVARALAEGAPVLVSPALGDMAETGARVAWAGAGLMLPGRWLRPGPLRWTMRRLLAERRFSERAGEIAAWAGANPGASAGAGAVERCALDRP
jgi:UDP:flavonoid glycosyltransferase YjiC (YdhE family)